MIIRQKFIFKVEPHFGLIKNDQRIALGVRNLARFKNVIAKLQLNPDLIDGETILPASDFGRYSKFNAVGKYIPQKDQPKETAYREAIWKWIQWCGKGETEECEKIVDVPYKRYPRKFIVPPSCELKVVKRNNDEALIIGPLLIFRQDNFENIIHVVNLFLEIFGECEIFTDDLESIINIPTLKVNWKILPPGVYPWVKLKPYIDHIISRVKKGIQKLFQERIQTILSFAPDFHVVGNGGFKDYVGFGFSKRNIYIFECSRENNATYVFKNDWQKLSKLSKAEILNQRLQLSRIIHLSNWKERIITLMNSNP